MSTTVPVCLGCLARVETCDCARPKEREEPRAGCVFCMGDESLDGGDCAACGRDLYDSRGPGGNSL